MSKSWDLKAFTLIELLIVVAIIAILAAIAVPNFLEAQVRSKVSRVKNDHRALATALESYRIDNNRYPPDPIAFNALNVLKPTLPAIYNYEPRLRFLTTPIPYITTVGPDIFNVGTRNAPQYYEYRTENQIALDKAFGGASHPANKYGTSYLWVVSSFGPDRTYSGGRSLLYGMQGLHERPVTTGVYGALYDPTNGTLSLGDIIRVGP